MKIINLREERYKNNLFSIKKYNDDLYKFVYHKEAVRQKGFKFIQDQDINREINEFKLDNNISRAKNMIFEYANCNDFEYFITLSLDQKKYDRYDLAKFIKDLGRFIRNTRQYYNSDIQYILIPEQHKDGAWHMHGLIKGITKDHLQINNNGYLDWVKYSDKFGFCSIDPIKSKIAVSKYILKYVRKALAVELEREKEKKLYYNSRGLKRAIKVSEGTLPSSELDKVPRDYENDYIVSKMLNGMEYLKLKDQLYLYDDHIIKTRQDVENYEQRYQLIKV